VEDFVKTSGATAISSVIEIFPLFIIFVVNHQVLYFFIRRRLTLIVADRWDASLTIRLEEWRLHPRGRKLLGAPLIRIVSLLLLIGESHTRLERSSLLIFIIESFTLIARVLTEI
jgi:hypothetical protein